MSLEELAYRRSVVTYARRLRACENPIGRKVLEQLLSQEATRAEQAVWMRMSG